VLGALLIGALTSALRDSFRFWEITIAVVFIVIVLVYPQGLIGLFAPLERWWSKGRKQAAALDAPAREQAGGAARLSLEDVELKVGEVLILDRLSLAIDRPGIFCVIGPNGAGKTSTFNVLTGELRAQAGRVRFDGIAIDQLQTHRVIALGIGRKLQIPSVFAHLSIADNLAIALWSGRAKPADLLRPRLRRWSSPLLRALHERYPFLADTERTASELAHGERQILELALALLSEPRLLLLDEPCAGLSPQETAQVIDVIRWASERRGATVVVIEHDMSLVRTLADHVFVLHNGRLLAQGSVADIQANEAVKAIYVGSEK
jgi:branched-chain amino acid transport system permease protein